MNRLSKEKRSQLLLAIVIIAVVITGIYMSLIRSQRQSIDNLGIEIQKSNHKRDQIIETSKNEAKINAELSSLKKELDLRETEMVSDDLYASAINLVRNFKNEHPLEIKQFMSKGAADNTVFAKFPYRQFTVSILGSGRYHDIGRFIADFENRFHSARVLNLELTPGGATSPDDAEQLVFRMDIVLLVKPTATSATKKP